MSHRSGSDRLSLISLLNNLLLWNSGYNRGRRGSYNISSLSISNRGRSWNSFCHIFNLDGWLRSWFWNSNRYFYDFRRRSISCLYYRLRSCYYFWSRRRNYYLLLSDYLRSRYRSSIESLLELSHVKLRLRRLFLLGWDIWCWIRFVI